MDTVEKSAAPATAKTNKARAKVLDCRILIADDDRLNRELIAIYLTKSGFTQLDFAEDGLAALRQVMENPPDLLILDIVMPGLDGYEVCRQLRAGPDGDALPIIVQTGLERPEDCVRVFEVGATDLVAKPINSHELIARVCLHLEHRLLVRGLRDYREAMKREMASAREMQHALMPQGAEVRRLEARYNIEIASFFQSSSEIGGDLWGVVALDDTQFGVYMVDFSGHGITAALNTFRLHTMLQGFSRSGTEPAALLAEMNGLLSHLLARGQFATMLFGVADVARDTFTYAAAASPRPFLRHAPGAEILRLDGSGVPLGVAAGVAYETRQVPFAAGAMLFTYSDALVEANRADGSMFDEDALATMAAQHAAVAGAAEFLDGTLASALEDVVYPLADDLTVLCIRRKPA